MCYIVYSSVQQFKSMHYMIGAFEVSLFVFLPEPRLMLILLLALYQYKMGQVSKSVKKSNNVHNFLQDVFVKCFF